MWGGISDAASVDGDVRELANATLENVRSRLLAIHGDTGFVASFQFLLGLALSASPGVDRASLGELAVDLEANPSPLKLASALGQYVADNRQSAEYAEIARKAAVDVISVWTEQQTRQLSFTGEHEQAAEVWRRASDGRGSRSSGLLLFFWSLPCSYWLLAQTTQSPRRRCRRRPRQPLSRHPRFRRRLSHLQALCRLRRQ